MVKHKITHPIYIYRSERKNIVLHKTVYSRPWRHSYIAAGTRYYVLLYIVIIIVGRDEKLDNRDESHNSQNISPT